VSGRLLDFDPLTQTSTVFHELEDGKTWGLESLQKADQIIEANKLFMNGVDERARYGEMDRVASIPMNLYFELKRNGIADDPVAFKRWLDDPDNRAFRTRPGRLSR
jgi:hypothetical protein